MLNPNSRDLSEKIPSGILSGGLPSAPTEERNYKPVLLKPPKVSAVTSEIKQDSDKEQPVKKSVGGHMLNTKGSQVAKLIVSEQ